MSKFGTKYTCWSCGTKFYDLNKPEPKCPKCGADPKAGPEGSDAGQPALDDELPEDVDLAPTAGEEEE